MEDEACFAAGGVLVRDFLGFGSKLEVADDDGGTLCQELLDELEGDTWF